MLCHIGQPDASSEQITASHAASSMHRSASLTCSDAGERPSVDVLVECCGLSAGPTEPHATSDSIQQPDPNNHATDSEGTATASDL